MWPAPSLLPMVTGQRVFLRGQERGLVDGDSSPPPRSGDSPSRPNLRRIRYQFKRCRCRATLRTAFLLNRWELSSVGCGSGKRMTLPTGERLLSESTNGNAYVFWWESGDPGRSKSTP